MALRTSLPPRARAKKPKDLLIKARRLDFVFDASLPRYWYYDDPFLTHFMHALSLTFPDGERLFMDAVRALETRVEDREMRADIRGFLGQEALHARAHEALNELLSARGYPVARLLDEMRAETAEQRRTQGKRNLLAMTCALEHITAIMGHRLLSSPELQGPMPEAMRRLWLWHALEETEHKAVAFDVYQEVYGDLRTRRRWLVLSTLGLMSTVLRFQATLLAHDGLATSPALWLKGMWRLWGPRGILSPLVPVWLAYFKSDFHPWQIDDRDLIARFRKELDDQVRGAKSSRAENG